MIKLNRYRNSIDLSALTGYTLVTPAKDDIIASPSPEITAPVVEEKKIWGFLDKAFGLADQGVGIYDKLRGSNSGDSGTSVPTTAELGRIETPGVFGMQKPWGAVILVTAITAISLVVYKKAIKK